MSSFFKRLSKSKRKEEDSSTGYVAIGGHSIRREPTLTDRMKEATPSQKRKIFSASTLYQLRRDHKIKVEKPENGFRSIQIYQFDEENKALANLEPRFPDELVSPETLEFFGFDQVIAHEIWALYRNIIARPERDDPSGKVLILEAENFAEGKYFDLWSKDTVDFEGNWGEEMGFNSPTQSTLGEISREIEQIGGRNDETSILQVEALSLKKEGEKLMHKLLCECTYGNHHSDYKMMKHVKEKLLGMAADQEAAMKKMLSKMKLLQDRVDFGEAAGIGSSEEDSKGKGKEEDSYEISKAFTNHLDDTEKKLVKEILLKVGNLCISAKNHYLGTLTPAAYVGLLDLLNCLRFIKFDSSPIYAVRILLRNRFRCLEGLEKDLAKQLNIKL